MEEALALLERPGAVALGGGTTVNVMNAGEPIEVVDLQALRLSAIEPLEGKALLLGATATLQDVAEAAEVPAVIREAARRELPSTLRSLATIAGCVVAAEPESELLAALLVHDATVLVLGRGGPAALHLPALLADGSLLGGRLITAVRIDARGTGCSARTARTAADRPIVAAVGRRTATGERRLALSGVADTPVLVESLETLNPRGDFRGSSEYRLSLARTLSARVLQALS